MYTQDLLPPFPTCSVFCVGSVWIQLCTVCSYVCGFCVNTAMYSLFLFVWVLCEYSYVQIVPICVWVLCEYSYVQFVPMCVGSVWIQLCTVCSYVCGHCQPLTRASIDNWTLIIYFVPYSRTSAITLSGFVSRVWYLINSFHISTGLSCLY